MAIDSEATDDLERMGAKKSPVVLIVLAVNVVLVLGVGAYLMFGSKAGAAEGGTPPLAPAATAEPGSIPIDPGNFSTEEMKAFIVNLSGEDGNRYLKVALTVRLSSPEAAGRFATVLPAVRDQFIRHLTSLTLDDLSTSEKKQKLKKELVARAGQVLPRGDVIDVYFTEFVVQ